MSQKEDEILVRELSKLGASGGAIGGCLADASLSTRHLPDNRCELTIEINDAASIVLKTAITILSKEGRIINELEQDSDLTTVFAMIGSGVFQLTPALVKVEIIPVTDNSSKVSIRGTAKEGLIKQRAGEKAARRIESLLTQAFA